MNVAVIGASQKPDRYSYKAIDRLAKAGHRVYPVHPALKEVLGFTVYPSLSEVPQPIDTVTVYVNADRSGQMLEEFLLAKPKRIILNPGAENDSLKRAAEAAGISVVEGCTLVLLATGQF